ncbi:MAG TPA: hypothetical protein VNW97_21880 [Candidatus Saccharimonadales bacterium]|jgi:hypothetical protein|nr:hypothetical protein [Candidatus Saccharimonadales bacterium]
MEPKALLTHIKPEWQNAFSQFVKTGEATDDFLVYLDKDEDAQQAVEKAFKAQAAAFENLAGEMKKVGAAQISQAATAEPYVVESLSATVAGAMEKILDLPARERIQVMENTASALRASPKLADLRSVVQKLEKAL